MSPTAGNLVGGAFDPFELPDTLQLSGIDDPYPLLATARRNGPVQATWPLPFDLIADAGGDAGTGGAAPRRDDQPLDDLSVSVLGHDAALAVLRDHESFSSTILSEMMGPVLGHTMIAMDEPEHRAHRGLVAAAFRPRLLARWEDDLVRGVVDDLLDVVAPTGRADLVRRLTFAFPVRVIARILGLPERDTAQFQRWSIELVSMVVNWDRGVAASRSLRDYFAQQVAERRVRPGDDLISELVETELDGERLTDEAIFAFLRLLLPAGVETTYRSFGNLLFALLTHPDQLEEITADPSLRGRAIEEALRWETPLLVIPRRCLRTTRVADVDIPEGSNVNVFLGSANRDEAHYPDPDRFDLHRTPAPHISFGSGPHMCLGMHLARMETRVALDAVLERLPGLALDADEPAPKIVGTFFRSPDALPARFEPTRIG